MRDLGPEPGLAHAELIIAEPGRLAVQQVQRVDLLLGGGAADTDEVCEELRVQRRALPEKVMSAAERP